MIDRMNAQGGTEVIANPELVGDEADLTGLEVAGTKYKVSAPSGTLSTVYLNTDYTIGGEITDEGDISMLNALLVQANNGIYPLPFLCNYGEDYCILDFIANVYIGDEASGFITGTNIRIEYADGAWTVETV